MTSLAAQSSFRSSCSGSSRNSSRNSSSSSKALGSASGSAAAAVATPHIVRPPPDACRLVLLLLFLHGVGVLLPWNIFINAKEYFQDYKLNTTASAGADYRINFMNYVGLAAQIPNTVMSGFNVFYQPTAEEQQTGSGFCRIAVCIVVEVLVCCATVALSFVDTSASPEAFFAFTIASVVIINSCTGVYQSAAFGIAAQLPMRYSNALVIGSNACGTVIAVVNICSKAASSAKPQQAAAYYFTFAIFVLLLCLATLALLPRLQFYRFHQLQRMCGSLSVQQQQQQQEESGDESVPLITDSSRIYSCQLSESLQLRRGRSCCQSARTLRECCAFCCFPPAKAAPLCSKYWRRYASAFADCWPHCLSVWCVFFCTLSCFPAIQASVLPADPLRPLLPAFWFTDVLVFLLFNLCAMAGNLVSQAVQVPPPRLLAPAVWLRAALFIPFFLACNFFPHNRPASFPVLVRSDVVFAVGMALFALSSGHLSSLCMMYAPRCVSDPRLADLAAMICAFCLVFGVVSGVAFGSLLFKVMYVA